MSLHLTVADFNTYILNQYTGADFGAKLQQAINTVPAGSTIDCSGVSGITLNFSSPVNITKGLNILLGANVLTTAPGYTGNMFNFQADGITLKGVSRSTKEGLLNGKTRLIMNSGDYHIFGQGVNQVRISDLDLIGVQSTINTTDGSGGIFFVEPDPYQAGGGNNVNQINIDQVLISKTKAHGIFILGCILSEFSNVRVSSAGGHGLYAGDGCTTLALRNFYVSSANYAGICLHSATSCTLTNCAGEGAGVGIWLRSCFNVVLVGCYAEGNSTRANTGIPANLGVQVTTTTLVTPITTTVDDIGSDNQSNFFKGASLVMTGGLGNIALVFNSTNPGQAGSVGASTVTSHVWIRDGARGHQILGLRTQKSGAATGTPRFDIRIESTGSGTPRDCYFDFNYEQDGTVTPAIANKYITTSNSSGESTVVLNQGVNCRFQPGSRTISGEYLLFKTGTSNTPNTRAGTVALSSGSATVNNTSVTANTKVFITRDSIGGTAGNLTYTVTAGTSFTITSSSGSDSSTVSWFLVEFNS